MAIFSTALFSYFSTLPSNVEGTTKLIVRMIGITFCVFCYMMISRIEHNNIGHLCAFLLHRIFDNDDFDDSKDNEFIEINKETFAKTYFYRFGFYVGHILGIMFLPFFLWLQ